MPRIRTQLAIQAPPDLLTRVKAAATARGQTVTRLLIDWIEVGLAGDLPAPAARPDLLARVEALEAAMALMQALPRPSHQSILAAPTEPVSVAPFEGDALPDRRLTPAEAVGLLTTPEVADALGLASGSAMTNWIRREAAKRGGSAVGGIYRGYRLRGNGLLPGGQKAGWLWEQA